MIPISEALQIIEKQVGTLSTEPIGLENSVGRVLAEKISADMDLPPFDRSQMDGFAVKLKDTKNAAAKLKIVGEAAAGKGFDSKIKSGEAVRIMTGARVPDGADAVQKVELTREENGFITILEPTKLQQNIVKRAAEIRQGARIFKPGKIITENIIAVLASFGYAKVKVFKMPKVSILATGSEIVDVSEKPQRDQIRNSNSMTLKVLAEKCGAEAQITPSVKDDLENLKMTIQNSSKSCDVLIISGGVSVGDYDFTKPALREVGAEIFFQRVALRPGKPTVFAKLNDCLIFGLPGNPVSAAVTFYLFVRSAILQMQGVKHFELKEGFAVLANKIKGAKGRDSYVPAKLKFNENAQIIVESLKWLGSSDFVTFSKADCLIFVPQDSNFEAEEIVKILFLPN